MSELHGECGKEWPNGTKLPSPDICTCELFQQIQALESRNAKLENVLKIIASYNMECTVETMNYHKRIAEEALAALNEKEGKKNHDENLLLDQ